jgi:three-Cys-motif partner protein
MLRDPFDDYVFCEKKANRLAALQRRVERLAVDRDLTGNVNYVLGDANEKVDEILEHVPETGKVLSLCFSDPYSLGPNFTTIQALASGWS